MQNNDNELKPVEPENYELQPSGDKTVINESMANTQPLTEDKFEPAPEAPHADNVAQIKQPIDKQVENAIESNPEVAEQVAENVSGENSPIETEAEQLNDSNPNNDEVNNEAIEQTPTKEKQEILDRLNNAGSSFLRVYKPISSYKEDTGEKDEKGKPVYRSTYDPDARNAYEDYVKKGEKYSDPRNGGVYMFGYPTPKELVYNTLTDDSIDLDTDLLGYGKDTPLPKKIGDNKATYEFLMNSPFMQKYMNYFDDAVTANARREQEGIEDKEGYVQRFIDFADSIFGGDEKELEEQIESHPEVTQQIAEETLGENNPITKEAEQVTDGDGRTDEVNNKQVEEALEKSSTVDDLHSYLDQFGDEHGFVEEPDNKAAEDTAGLIDWDKVKVYEPGEDATGYGIQQEPFDPRVEENLNYDYDQNIPQDDTFETSITNTTQDFSPEIGELSDVVDYGLEDQNQYGADLPSEDETVIDEKMANTEPLSDDNFEPAPEAPYADNVVQLKQQKEQLDKELEEAEAEPVTDKESAIRKQNRVKMARAAIANFNASNPNFESQIQQSNGSVSTGGRVSPSAGIGNIGGGVSGHGSMSPVNSRRADNAINAGRAGGGSMPVTLGSGSSKVIQPSRSFSNGSLSSGSFGLMSKNKGNGAFSSKPVSLPNGESSSVVEGVNVDSIAESGKNALVERLKALLDKLSPEQRKQLGFSPKVYDYQGERLEDLDGYTIQKLLEEVEKLVGSF